MRWTRATAWGVGLVVAGLAVGGQPWPKTIAPGPVTRLTVSGARNGQPFFSPDGQWVSFVSDRGGSWQAWVMRPDGSAVRQVTDEEGPVGWPSWSADGASLLYYADTESGYQLFEIGLSGRGRRHLLEPGPPSFRPLLSPSRRLLLFDRYGVGEPPSHDLFVLHLDSGELTRLTDDRGYDSDARWSPEGRRIVFHSDRDSAERYHTQIYRLTVAGGEPVRLTDGPARNAYPAWSPDGGWIVYTSEVDGDRDLWVMTDDGSRARRLTSRPGFDGDPVWSPDGGSILFSTDRYGDSRELARLDLVFDR